MKFEIIKIGYSPIFSSSSKDIIKDNYILFHLKHMGNCFQATQKRYGTSLMISEGLINFQFSPEQISQNRQIGINLQIYLCNDQKKQQIGYVSTKSAQVQWSNQKHIGKVSTLQSQQTAKQEAKQCNMQDGNLFINEGSINNQDSFIKINSSFSSKFNGIENQQSNINQPLRIIQSLNTKLQHKNPSEKQTCLNANKISPFQLLSQERSFEYTNLQEKIIDKKLQKKSSRAEPIKLKINIEQTDSSLWPSNTFVSSNKIQQKLTPHPFYLNKQRNHQIQQEQYVEEQREAQKLMLLTTERRKPVLVSNRSTNDLNSINQYRELINYIIPFQKHQAEKEQENKGVAVVDHENDENRPQKFLRMSQLQQSNGNEDILSLRFETPKNKINPDLIKETNGNTKKFVERNANQNIQYQEQKQSDTGLKQVEKSQTMKQMQYSSMYWKIRKEKESISFQ